MSLCRNSSGNRDSICTVSCKLNRDIDDDMKLVFDRRAALAPSLYWNVSKVVLSRIDLLSLNHEHDRLRAMDFEQAYPEA
jgi:hypothetical protein